MKTHLKSPRTHFQNCFIHPAISGRSRPRILSAKITEIVQKFEKIDLFKSRYIVIQCPEIWFLAGNRSVRPRKAPRNPILPFLRNMAQIYEKSKKIVFLISKIMIKNFPKSIFPTDESRLPNRYQESIHPIGAPKALES